MIGRSAGFLVDMPVQLYAGRWQIAPRAGKDLRRTADLLERDLDQATEQGDGYAGPFKIQSAGPWTLSTGVDLPIGGRLLRDAGARLLLTTDGSPPALTAVLGADVPARADHDTAHTVAQMTAHYRDPALEFQNRPFALLYPRTTEGMRDANAAGEFADPTFWDRRVIPTFADRYLDAYRNWTHG